MSKQALIVIDVQNDYFPNGKYPLWNTESTLSNIISAIKKARDKGIPVFLVQHIANATNGTSAFFNEKTTGVEINPRILATAPDAVIVTKAFADSFRDTKLDDLLSQLSVTELLICGMMTQNCVTHTAISKDAEKYSVKILADCCTSVSQMIHALALNAISNRVALVEAGITL